MTNHNITDADRYRWTRAAWLDGADTGEDSKMQLAIAAVYTPEEMDAAIDAELQKPENAHLLAGARAGDGTATDLLLVPRELLKDAADSIDDYRCSLEFGAFDRKLLDRLKAALAAAPAAAPAVPYNMDLDPAGIRALVSDAISGALALGAQNESPAPDGHWLGHFWQLGRQHDEWRATVWAVARALNCLPSTFSDANGHVFRAAERLMAERDAAMGVSPAPATGSRSE